ncbi:MAG: peptide-methionine (S)-S-oxide reductase MsrA [Candidatus Bathyarchaeota archaeon]|nr:peptide-methionine (S)-S-oxide reductase MsrA [Candidatus Bathyarchaeota archaeon]
MTTEVATLGGGCFWCTEAVFDQINGVTNAVSGYSGGTTPNPSYEQVCGGKTGHAEVVQVHFDPEIVSYKEILQIFFATHDPTTLNQQGADFGTQYRSVIFYHNNKQKAVAEQVIAEYTSENVYGSPIVTAVEPFSGFFVAEDYHQNYFSRNPDKPYCRAVISPKVAKLRQKLFDKLKR